MKFSIKEFVGKCNQVRSFLRIWSRLLKKFLMENFIFWAVMLMMAQPRALQQNFWKLCKMSLSQL